MRHVDGLHGALSHFQQIQLLFSVGIKQKICCVVLFLFFFGQLAVINLPCLCGNCVRPLGKTGTAEEYQLRTAVFLSSPYGILWKTSLLCLVASAVQTRAHLNSCV